MRCHLERQPSLGIPELRILFGIIILLALGNLLNNYFGQPFWPLTKQFWLGSDNNISAWFSSFLLVIAGLLAYDCFRLSRRLECGNPKVLMLLVLLLFGMSCDEVARLHEWVFGNLSSFLGVPASISKHTNWVWTGGPIIVCLFLAFAIALWRTLALVPRCRMLMGIGFALIVIGGVILESTINFLNHGNLQWLWDIEIVVEEIFEMLGSLALAYALCIWRDSQLDLAEGKCTPGS